MILLECISIRKHEQIQFAHEIWNKHAYVWFMYIQTHSTWNPDMSCWVPAALANTKTHTRTCWHPRKTACTRRLWCVYVCVHPHLFSLRFPTFCSVIFDYMFCVLSTTLGPQHHSHSKPEECTNALVPLPSIHSRRHRTVLIMHCSSHWLDGRVGGWLALSHECSFRQRFRSVAIMTKYIIECTTSQHLRRSPCHHELTPSNKLIQLMQSTASTSVFTIIMVQTRHANIDFAH